MSKCLWCEQEVVHSVTIRELIFFCVKERVLCSSCSNRLDRLGDYDACMGCNKKMNKNEEICKNCLSWRKIYPHIKLRHRAIYSYNSFGKEVISRFKYLGDCEMASMFSEDIKELTHKNRRNKLIIPIPISNQSMKERGFNQTELLLEAADINYINVLKSSDCHDKQSKKNRMERLNSPQPFILNSHMEQEIKEKDVVIADDIYTTGRTIYHAAHLISQYQPASINSISLFR